MLTTALVLATLLQASSAQDLCAHDPAALIALTPEAFDQDMDGGWRPLAEKAECREAAADLLAAYRTAHWGDLDADELHLNYWHEGQVRASMGQTASAVRLLMAGVNPAADSGGFENYALGTIAFLQKDRSALQAARDRLAATPQPPEFAQAAARYRAQYGGELAWPLNLDILDGFLACFDRTYDEAYGDCRP